MLNVHVRGADGRITLSEEPRAALAAGSAVWVDFFTPANAGPQVVEEERLIEAALGIDAPTPQERAAIEESARYYEEYGALTLTATLMGQRGEGLFVSDAVTFILKNKQLVTVRAITPRAFAIGKSRSSARIELAGDGGEVLLALLEGLLERIADILHETTTQANQLSGQVFVADAHVGEDILKQIGKMGTLVALCHASLSSLHRLVAFTHTVCDRHGLPAARLAAFEKDVQELERSAEALQEHLGFLLDGALGLVGAAQNNTLKALSLATIAFVPPTLIASFFGMNFATLGWIDKPWGPWAAAFLMVLAPAALFAIAKTRNWF
jgi:magnesium transporter